MIIEPITGKENDYMVRHAGLSQEFREGRDMDKMIEWARTAQLYAKRLTVGAELKDYETGEKRYVLEPVDRGGYLQISGDEFGDQCRCKSWYTVQEIFDTYTLTGEVVEVSELSTFEVQCDHDCDEDHD